MKKQFAMILMGFLLFLCSIWGYHLEMNASYDSFRGVPDGSWNGNYGAYVSANTSTEVYKCINFQLGGSYGIYNWNGRQNQVFDSPQTLLQEGFLTTGFGFNYGCFNTAIVYDRIFTSDFGIYNVDPTFDQLRLHEGFRYRCEEFGVWGTVRLTTANKDALGLPLSFRAVNQVNLFWTHFFSNSARTTVWLGMPYSNGLMSSGLPGNFIIGFAARAPIAKCLYIDSYGSYMGARRTSSIQQTRNYSANICVGITYMFNQCCAAQTTLLPVANNSNFIIDSNINN